MVSEIKILRDRTSDANINPSTFCVGWVARDPQIHPALITLSGHDLEFFLYWAKAAVRMSKVDQLISQVIVTDCPRTVVRWTGRIAALSEMIPIRIRHSPTHTMSDEMGRKTETKAKNKH